MAISDASPHGQFSKVSAAFFYFSYAPSRPFHFSISCSCRRADGRWMISRSESSWAKGSLGRSTLRGRRRFSKSPFSLHLRTPFIQRNILNYFTEPVHCSTKDNFQGEARQVPLSQSPAEGNRDSIQPGPSQRSPPLRLVPRRVSNLLSP